MIRNVAVVAHFDADDILDENFLEIISCLEEIFDKIILVTTSDIKNKNVLQFSKLTLIKRPNIGYDFYSYRVGLQHAGQIEGLESVLLINSSFILLEPQRFKNALRRMIALVASNDVVGATSSLQENWHLQSYLLLVGRAVVLSSWFRDYVDGIRPLNTKLETILRYELGLSAAFLAHDTRTTTLFEPTKRELAGARSRWSKTVIEKIGIAEWLDFKRSGRIMKFNPTHFLAGEIARQFGYVKTELLRDNPHLLNVDFVRELADEPRLRQIDDMVQRLKRYYRTGENNLTTLSSGNLSLQSARRVQWRHPHAPGVDVAVVLHLYYFDLLEEVCSYLGNILPPFDLFVTTPFEGDVAAIINRCSRFARSVSVLVFENRGRDVGPFVALYRSGALDGYAAVLKVHSKKSKYSDQGGAWRDRLFRGVAGDSLAVQKTLRILASGEVGIVGPHAYYLTHERFWGANHGAMRRLLTAMELLGDAEEPELGFFAGSMFWFNPNALHPLKSIPEEELAFESEDGRLDGTLAHALERLFCPIARKSGYRTSSVTLGGSEIHFSRTLENHVPVL